MSETQTLLGKIAALRQRLEQSRRLTQEAATVTAALVDEACTLSRTPTLARVVGGGEHDLVLDRTVRPVSGVIVDDLRPMPKMLTSRARRVLERARGLLGQLRVLSDAFAPAVVSADEADAAAEMLDHGAPLAVCYRQTAAIADTTLRMIPLFPDSATGQLHLCEGLEAILNVVAARVETLNAGVARHRHEREVIDQLAELLGALEAGRAVDVQAFSALVEEIHAEALEGVPLVFAAADPGEPARHVAAHGLTVARVLARVVRHDPELRGRAADAILAALVHDVGMLRVAPPILTHAGALDDEQKRAVESHCRIGAALVTPLHADGWLADAVQRHHERLDGTGYPDGLREAGLSSLARLLAVCDVYAALCSRRPHRPARETRTALTDTLLLAEQGQLDRHHAERLLALSFYPVGTAVELADGAIGVVVAAPALHRELSSPAKPVVAVLLDPDGQPQPLPRVLDLAQTDNHSIVRTLSSGERRELLGGRFPEWA
jgi:hypothetical protein